MSADPSSENVSAAVVNAVASHRGVEPTALPPLYHAIDPDALDDLFQSPAFGTEPESGEIRFTFAGCQVVVTSAGRVDATPIEPDSGGEREE